MNTIISKRLSTFTYQKWAYPNGQATPDGPGIIINGGAGVVGGLDLLSNRPLEKRSETIPVGVHTYVDDDTLDKLMSIPKFIRDIDTGIIAVVKGERLDQEATDNIAAKDMLEDEHIAERPYSEEDIENAGGVIGKDGGIDISEADEDINLTRQRNAGAPEYVKKRNLENKKQEKAEKKRAVSRRKK